MYNNHSMNKNELDFSEAYDDFDQFDSISKEEKFDGIGLTYLYSDSINQKIESLADVFTEWFLFETSNNKSILSFLQSEGIDAVISETDFMDIISGYVAFNEETIIYIQKKLPFAVRLTKLHTLNYKVIHSDIFKRTIDIDVSLISDKIKQLNATSQKEKAQKKLIAAKIAYAKDPQKFIDRSRKWIANNRETANQIRYNWAKNNPDKVKIARKKSYEKNGKSTEFIQKNRQRATEWKKKNPEKRRESVKKHYELNKEKILAQSKLNYQKRKLKTTAPVISSILGAIITSKQK